MVAAESTFEVPQDEAYLVSQRKYNLDPSRPWWQRAFFRCVFLPFVRFSFKYMKIPAAGAIEPDGRIVIIEQQGIYFHEGAAEEVCARENEFWQWKPILLNTEIPAESVQYQGARAPLSIMPDRYRRRSYPATTARISQLLELKETIQNISKTAAGA